MNVPHHDLVSDTLGYVELGEQLRDMATTKTQHVLLRCHLDIHPYTLFELLSEIDFQALIALTISNHGDSILTSIESLNGKSLLALPQAPQLVHLGLIHTNTPFEVFEHILRSDAFPGLKSLDASRNHLTAFDVASLKKIRDVTITNK